MRINSLFRSPAFFVIGLVVITYALLSAGSVYFHHQSIDVVRKAESTDAAKNLQDAVNSKAEENRVTPYDVLFGSTGAGQTKINPPAGHYTVTMAATGSIAGE